MRPSMTRPGSRGGASSLLAAITLLAGLHSAQEPGDQGEPPEQASPVKIIRCPDGGQRPRLRRDGLGILHMIYVDAASDGANLFYRRSTDGGDTFSEPIRVNGVDGSVDASESSRGASVATGRDGRVHVAWMGSEATAVEVAGEGGAATRRERALFHARLADDRKSFEPEHNLIRSRWGITATPGITADAAGNVYVFWHAPGDELPPEGADPTEFRRVWMVSSADDGATFSEERVVDDVAKGATDRCGLDADIDEDGTIYALYRCSTERRKDMRLLYSEDGGQTFGSSYVDTWRRRIPPQTNGMLKQGGHHLVATWETEGQVFFAPIRRKTNKILQPFSPKAKPDEIWRQRPTATGNEDVSILVWVEGNRGEPPTRLGWRTFDILLRAPLDRGYIEDVPPGTVPDVFVRPDGSFAIVY